MPSSAVGSVGNDKGAVYCFLFIPPSVAWAAGLSRWGYPPLNPGRPPERAGESTRTPLISPEKLALPRPARGAPLASSLAGFFRETGGQWGPHPRTSPCAPVWPTASAYGFFLPPRRVNLDFDLSREGVRSRWGSFEFRGEVRVGPCQYRPLWPFADLLKTQAPLIGSTSLCQEHSHSFTKATTSNRPSRH